MPRRASPTSAASRATVWLVALGTVTLVAGCPKPEGDLKRSQTHLDLATAELSEPRPNLDMVIDEATQAIGYLSTNEEAYNLRGVAYLLRAQLAKHSLDTADCLTGLDAEAQQAEVDEQLGKAGPDFERAVALAPDFSEGWFNRGNVAMANGDPSSAVEYFSKALENPMRLTGTTKARVNLGIAHFEAGDNVSAAKELRQALQFEPQMCVGRFWLGRVYFASEEWEKAGEFLEGVVDDGTCNYLQEARLYLMKTRLQQGLLDQERAAKASCISTARKSCVASQCRSEGVPL